MALPVKAHRYPVPLSLGVGGGVLLPPDVVYAKPASHAIYYATTFPAPTLATLAKYSSVSIAAVSVADPAPLKAAVDALRAANPTIKLFAYNMTAEKDVRGTDYGGTYGFAGQKLTDAEWLLRNAANAFYITYNAGDGTFLPDRGAWSTGVSYAVNDVVKNAGVYYKCTSAHTSPGSFSTASGWTSTLGTMAINICDGVLPDHGGLSWAQYYARHAHYVATRGGATWDGAYLDLHGYPDEGVLLDWENTGTDVLLKDTASAKRKVEAASREFITELTTQFGAGFKILGNTNGNIAPQNLLTEYVTTQGMSAWADGWLHESTISPSVFWSYLCR